MVQAPIRVQPNLVVIPVFVLNKRNSQETATEWQCTQSQNNLFERASPDKPFILADCEALDVHGLGANDFELLQDGVRQKIERLTVEHWGMLARDNKTWHAETSLTPSSIWSSSDVGGSPVPDTRTAFPDIQTAFYNLAYVPDQHVPGCHKITVDVDRPGTLVLARDAYCTGQMASDSLYGTDAAKRLESHLAPGKKAKLPLNAQAGFVYVGKNQTRVDISLRFPWNLLKFQWNLNRWMLEARISVLGVVYAQGGVVAARFSDVLYPSYWPTFFVGRLSLAPSVLFALDGHINDDMQFTVNRTDPAWLPARYEAQLDLSPGRYSLKVVLSDEENFGRVEVPLVIAGYDGKTFPLSSVMLCKRYRPAQVASDEYAAANFAPQYVPFVSGGLRFTPTADTIFRKGDRMIAYFEVYEPLTVGQSAAPITAQAQVLAAKDDTVLKLFPAVHVTEPPQARGSFWAIPVALKIPYEQFPKGAYRLEVHATDAAGQTTPWRTANFAVQ